MKEVPTVKGRNSQPHALGGLIARLLSGAWRETASAPEISAAELAKLIPLLNATGDAALGWWRIHNSELADSTAGRQLHEAYRRFRLAALLHEQEIKHVFSLLRAEGIEPVLVKGWAIARLYPDRGLRPYGDIDLCVRPDQFRKAERALKCLASVDGHYVDLHSGFAKLELWHGRPARESDHGHDAHATTLWDELFEHSQLVSLSSPCLRGELSERTTHHGVTEDTERIRVLSDEDHLRILCLHLLRSGAWRPLWLCDVAVALESRRADFDWDRCLTSDRKVAEWVACTIGLAQQLLGAGAGQRAKSKEQSAKREAQRAKGQAQRASMAEGTARFAPGSLPLALSSLPFARLPRWLAPAILRQWGRSLNPHAIDAALPALSAQMRERGKFFAEVYARWDQPVRATIALRGRFNNWPRLPYQLAELLLRSSEVPKQLASMIVRRSEELISRRRRRGSSPSVRESSSFAEAP